MPFLETQIMMQYRRILVFSLTLFVTPLFFGPAALRANSFNIDFGDENGAPSSTYGAASGQVGVWNNIASLGTTSNLFDLSGAATLVSLSLAADNISASQPVGFGDTEDLRADSFVSYNADAWQIVFSNLNIGSWSLYYYAPTGGLLSTGDFTANGVTVSSIKGTVSDNLAQGTDWDVVSGLVVTNGTLTLVSTGPSVFRGLAGAQLVQAPEPGTLFLMGFSMLGIGSLPRLRRAAPGWFRL